MRRSRSPTRHHDASRSPVDRRPRDMDNQYLSDQEGYVFHICFHIFLLKVPVQLWKHQPSKIDEKSSHIYNNNINNQVCIQILRQHRAIGLPSSLWTVSSLLNLRSLFFLSISQTFFMLSFATCGIATAKSGVTYSLKLLRVGQEATGGNSLMRDPIWN